MTSLNSSNNSQNQEERLKKSEQATVQYLMQTLQNLQRENEALKRDVLKPRRTRSDKIGFILLAVGALALVGSVVDTSTVLAFIGLGLTFWGALFLFARPIKFVPSTLLDSTAVSAYATIDRILEDLGYKGKPIYIPPYPREAYLPEYLKGLKEMIIFVPAEASIVKPTIEEIARKQFLLKNPKGMCIAPPGYGLTSLFERELKAKFSQVSTERLFDSLPTIVVSNLELAKEFVINPENGHIHIKIVDSVYKHIYSREQGFKSIHTIGCPLTSAVACMIAISTAKLVVIAKDAVSDDLGTIEVWYQTLEA